MNTICVRAFRLALVALAAGCAFCVRGQAPIRTSARLVEVNAIARDGKGNLVTDLPKESFMIEDNGQERQIALFALERRAGQAPVAPNTFSNHVENHASNVTVILFDELNTVFEDRVLARRELIKSFEQMKPEENAALYVLGSRLEALYDFTPERKVLAEAIANHNVLTGRDDWNVSVDALQTRSLKLDQLLRAAEQAFGDFHAINRALTTLSALEAIARHVGRIPGRKNLIWITSAFPFEIGFDTQEWNRERRVFSAETLRAVQALNNANIAVYTVDAAGVGARRGPGPGPIIYFPQGKQVGPVDTTFPVDRNFDTMKNLANQTGGEAYHNTNDLARAIRRAVEDSETTYTLGFYAGTEAQDGKFHTLKVHTKKKGVHLRHRPGYFALGDLPDLKRAPAPLATLLGNSLAATEIGLTVHLESESPTRVKAVVTIDPRNVMLTEKDAKWVGALDWLAGGGTKGIYSMPEKELNLTFASSAYHDFLAHGLRLTQNIELGELMDELGFAVRDQATGKAGSLRIVRRRK